MILGAFLLKYALRRRTWSTPDLADMHYAPRLGAMDLTAHEGWVANDYVEPTFAKHVWEFDLPVEGNETFGVQGFDLLAQGVVCIEINELIKGALNQRTTCRPLLLPILELGACEKRYWKYCAACRGQSGKLDRRSQPDSATEFLDVLLIPPSALVFGRGTSFW